ncbi:MAG TPA: hypothetical protein VN446_07925 [Candidatus Acidoferrum sp.]|nr:hypothetical protein [Candidatus Acidoferrum sp.]
MSEYVSGSGLEMTRAQAVTAVIYSIAQEDTALANLLSAEAANLWRVVGSESATVDQILAVSQNAQNTLAHIAEIEIRLLGKLTALSGELA